jgi:phosphoenolpyruvate carboxylase
MGISGATSTDDDNNNNTQETNKEQVIHYSDDVFLRNDVKFMGALLGKSIREHDGEAMFQKVETLRNLTKLWREHHDARKEKTSTPSAEEEEDFRNMVQCAAEMSNQELFVVSRAFTHFMSICNAAEAHHRSRRVWEELLKSSPDVQPPSDDNNTTTDTPASTSASTSTSSIRALRDSRDSCGRILSDLLKEGLTAEEIHQTILKQKVEFVLTAHPTEVNRRTLLDKRTRVQTVRS